MKRIKNLDTFQKVVLIIMAVMSLIFAVIYYRTITSVGYEYNDTIFIPTVEDGKTLYSGKIDGEKAQFIVSDENTVVLNYGEKTYGPYTVIEDATAIPKDDQLSKVMRGIEVREGNDILFRGGVVDYESYFMFYNEDGTPEDVLSFYTTVNGVDYDQDGNPIDRMKPSVSNIYELTHSPELTHKGMGFIWFFGAFICIINAVYIIFPDEIFRLRLAFIVRDVDKVEPAESELAARFIGWLVLPIMAFAIYIMGLK